MSVNKPDISAVDADDMSEEERLALVEWLEGEIKRNEELAVELVAEQEAMLKEKEDLERQVRDLEGEVKRASAKLFFSSNPPKYLREMMGR